MWLCARKLRKLSNHGTRARSNPIKLSMLRLCRGPESHTDFLYHTVRYCTYIRMYRIGYTHMHNYMNRYVHVILIVYINYKPSTFSCQVINLWPAGHLKDINVRS